MLTVLIELQEKTHTVVQRAVAAWSRHGIGSGLLPSIRGAAAIPSAASIPTAAVSAASVAPRVASAASPLRTGQREREKPHQKRAEDSCAHASRALQDLGPCLLSSALLVHLRVRWVASFLTKHTTILVNLTSEKKQKPHRN